ncbi:MAG: oxygen-independent coproporphyrinogen III oxidase [Prolixibacteraceae bacterium]
MTKLLEKYNKPVPRYTSYPPANFFTEEYTSVDYLKAIEDSNNWSPSNISFYFHVPFCKKLCYFCGCNSYGMRKLDAVDYYMKAMIKELKIVIGKLDKNRLVSQIHYGGGTPNAVDVKYLQEINELIFANFKFIDDPEIAIECNPAYLDEDQIHGLKKAGFKRFSLGIQDFEDDVLKAVNRDKPFMPLEHIMALLKEDDPEVKVNLDFIYGLPKQTAEGFAATIEKAAALKPDRLVTFSYAHVPWVSKIQKKLEVYGLPENNEKVKMNELAYAVMQKNGYEAIGMDHYAQSDDELCVAQRERQLHRNFQGYCTRRTTGQVYAFGVTGISQLAKVYAQNTKSIDEYIDHINKGEFNIIKGYELTDEQVLIRETITELMCNHRIIWEDLAARLNVSKEKLKSALASRPGELMELEQDGIIRIENENIIMNDEGAMFLRNVAATFDPLIGTAGKTFSTPV